jgi:hypothetical protein
MAHIHSHAVVELQLIGGLEDMFRNPLSFGRHKIQSVLNALRSGLVKPWYRERFLVCALGEITWRGIFETPIVLKENVLCFLKGTVGVAIQKKVTRETNKTY